MAARVPAAACGAQQVTLAEVWLPLAVHAALLSTATMRLACMPAHTAMPCSTVITRCIVRSRCLHVITVACNDTSYSVAIEAKHYLLSLQAAEAAPPPVSWHSSCQAAPPHYPARLPWVEHLLAPIISTSRTCAGTVIFDRAVIGLPDDVISGLEGHERGDT
jgi:hypothetical protein